VSFRASNSASHASRDSAETFGHGSGAGGSGGGVGAPVAASAGDAIADAIAESGDPPGEFRACTCASNSAIIFCSAVVPSSLLEAGAGSAVLGARGGEFGREFEFPRDLFFFFFLPAMTDDAKTSAWTPVPWLARQCRARSPIRPFAARYHAISKILRVTKIHPPRSFKI
jgi:hypothetical protein